MTDSSGIGVCVVIRFSSDAVRTEFRTVLEMFEALATKNPNQTYIVDAAGCHSYSEVDRQGRAIARKLQLVGVRHGDIVGLLADRSADFVAAVLGCWKVGAAYLPLDPREPPGRLASMFATARPAACLGAGEGDRTLAGVPLYCWGDRDSGSDEGDLLSDLVPAGANNDAYVIFTSGTTGEPKGVPVPHSNLVNLLVGCAQLLGTIADDAWSCIHRFSFDYSVWELFGPLPVGGRAVIMQTGLEAFGELEDSLRAEQVSVVSFTPSAFARFLEITPDAAALVTDVVRRLVFGGEALSPALMAGLSAEHGLSVFNMYGITEGTVHCTAHRLDLRSDDEEVNALIGAPLPGVRLLVDADLPVRGTVSQGELLVGGAAVARGYLRNAELTAQRFHLVDDETFYRTGDWVTCDSDLKLRFAGRRDDQVKIRGFRVELSEVEALMFGSGLVAEAAAAKVGEHLVAWVVLQRSIAPSALRADFRVRMPDHLVPDRIHVVKELPFTANGKVDRACLVASCSGPGGRTEICRRD